MTQNHEKLDDTNLHLPFEELLSDSSLAFDLKIVDSETASDSLFALHNNIIRVNSYWTRTRDHQYHCNTYHQEDCLRWANFYQAEIKKNKIEKGKYQIGMNQPDIQFLLELWEEDEMSELKKGKYEIGNDKLDMQFLMELLDIDERNEPNLEGGICIQNNFKFDQSPETKEYFEKLKKEIKENGIIIGTSKTSCFAHCFIFDCNCVSLQISRTTTGWIADFTNSRTFQIVRSDIITKLEN